MMGLTYSMDNGVDSTTITTSRGNVSVPHVDCYYNRGACTTAPDQPPEIAQNEAHAYGELTQGLERCPYATDEDIFKASQDCQYFKSNVSQEFAYRFAEYSKSPGSTPCLSLPDQTADQSFSWSMPSIFTGGKRCLLCSL